MIFFSIIIPIIYGQIALPGKCPDHIPDQANFDVKNYLGVWFTFMHNDHKNIPPNSNCVAATYGERDDS